MTVGVFGALALYLVGTVFGFLVGVWSCSSMLVRAERVYVLARIALLASQKNMALGDDTKEMTKHGDKLV